MLRGTLCHRDALHADGEARGVHHDKHGVEAAVLLADQVADGAVLLAEFHHARGAGVNAELVFEAGADDVVARTGRAVGIQQKLRHEEERDALGAGGCVRQAGQHHVDDVAGHLVLAVGDEDLGAEQAIRAVALRHGLGLHRGEIGTGLRLGEVHRAGPLAGDHFRQVGGFQRVRAVGMQRVDRALGQQRAQAERQVRRVPDLAGRHRHHAGQALAAEFFRTGQRTPAAFGELAVGFLPAGRRVDLAVDQFGGGLVADLVQRVEHLGAKFSRLLDDGANRILVQAFVDA